MHTVIFDTDDPYDLIPRALDLLRNMGFELIGIQSTRSGEQHSVQLRVKIGCTPTLHTFIERLRQRVATQLTVNVPFKG